MTGTRLGIDFGTSNTVAVLATGGERPRPLLFDGAELLPSAVCRTADGELLVGRDALHAARALPEAFEPNPKRVIDEGTVLLGGVEVDAVDLVAAVFRRVAAEAARVAGGPVHDVTVTCPASWGPTRRGLLSAAAAAAGFTDATLVAEPVAAAHAFAEGLVVGSHIVVYDFGAGTFDASVVRRAADGFEVLAERGLADTGGLDVDAAVVAYLGTVFAAQDPQRWARLAQPVTGEDRRLARMLWDDVRTGKEMLSRTSSTLIHVPLFGTDVPLGRDQLEQLARPILDRTVTATRAVVRAAGDAPQRVVFLVGGSSRIPLAATLLHQALGVVPVVRERPELVVAEGSLLATPPTPAASTAFSVPALPVPALPVPVVSSVPVAEPSVEFMPSDETGAAELPPPVAAAEPAPVPDLPRLPRQPPKRRARWAAVAGVVAVAVAAGVIYLPGVGTGTPDGNGSSPGPSTASSPAPPPTPEFREIGTYDANDSYVTGVSVTPDGTRYATSSLDGRVHLYQTGQSQPEILHQTGDVMKTVDGVALSPDAQVVAFAVQGGVTVKDVASKAQIGRLSGYAGPGSSIRFSPDGNILAVGFADGGVTLWDVATRKQRRTLDSGSDGQRGIAFDRTGILLAGAADSGKVRIWDVATGTVKVTLPGHTGERAHSVSFSPDATRLASGGSDGKLRIWDLTTNTEVQAVATGQELVDEVLYGPNGTAIVTITYRDNRLRLWDAKTYQVLATSQWSSADCLTVTADGKRLITGGKDSSSRIWDTTGLL
ncbi:Hsp70 family protein [Dactylosporangium sp. NBC_01737]|uniref:Hsp70 family protein n=1 Tax=Dactylosporangium sp. NBC_01737 TaxID=2975959 RepID=UPI002E13C95E|nr:Hsp70 family protein [Dactylosporangium sp. NBC_01737]